MNKLNFNQSGGFPFETNILDEMQKAYEIFNALGSIAGNFSIISGCEVVETTAANGVVFINGEVLQFVGGAVQANVKIVEAVTALEFEDLNSRNVIYTRHATFGTASVVYPWSDFKRGIATKDIPAALEEKVDTVDLETILERLTELEKKNAVFQVGGGMVLWNKPAIDIPDGWHEVINWRGRMPVGWNPDDTSFDTVSEIGGSKTAALSIPITGYTPGANVSEGVTGVLIVSSGVAESAEQIESMKKASAAPSASTANILNPYRVVLFIEYIETPIL